MSISLRAKNLPQDITTKTLHFEVRGKILFDPKECSSNLCSGMSYETWLFIYKTWAFSVQTLYPAHAPRRTCVTRTWKPENLAAVFATDVGNETMAVRCRWYYHLAMPGSKAMKKMCLRSMIASVPTATVEMLQRWCCPLEFQVFEKWSLPPSRVLAAIFATRR